MLRKKRSGQDSVESVPKEEKESMVGTGFKPGVKEWEL